MWKALAPWNQLSPPFLQFQSSRETGFRKWVISIFMAKRFSHLFPFLLWLELLLLSPREEDSPPALGLSGVSTVTGDLSPSYPAARVCCGAGLSWRLLRTCSTSRTALEGPGRGGGVLACQTPGVSALPQLLCFLILSSLTLPPIF